MSKDSGSSRILLQTERNSAGPQHPLKSGRISRTDPEAAILYDKKKGVLLARKVRIAVDGGPSRIVTGIGVTSGDRPGSHRVRVEAWRQRFLEAALEGLRARPDTPETGGAAPGSPVQDRRAHDEDQASGAALERTSRPDVSRGDVGFKSALVVDAGGYPCISYYDGTEKTLKYARKIGGILAYRSGRQQLPHRVPRHVQFLTGPGQLGQPPHRLPRSDLEQRRRPPDVRLSRRVGVAQRGGELAALTFVSQAANVILLGPPGLGKTYLP